MKRLTSSLSRSLTARIVSFVLAFVVLTVSAATWLTYTTLKGVELSKLRDIHKSMALSVNLYAKEIKAIIDDVEAKGLSGKPDSPEFKEYMANDPNYIAVYNLLSELGKQEYIGRPYLLYPDVVESNGKPATIFVATGNQLAEYEMTGQSAFELPQIFVDLMNDVQKNGKDYLGETPDYDDGDGIWMSTMTQVLDEDGNYIADFSIDFSYEFIHDELRGILWKSLGLGAILAIIEGILLVLLVRRILAPLQGIKELTQRAAVGDLTVELPEDRNDEFGELSKNFNEMSRGMRTLIREIHVNSAKVLDVSSKVKLETLVLVRTSDENQDNMQTITDGAVEQKVSLTEANRSTQEMASAIQKIAESSSHLADNSSYVASETDIIQSHMNSSREAINKVHSSIQDSHDGLQQVIENTKDIVNIVDRIKEIAEQTNLLSLNASIEAARAGEHGRGFAVVAGEIRKLAEHSKNASNDIVDILHRVSGSVDILQSAAAQSNTDLGESVVTIEQATESVNNIVSQIREVNSQVQEVSAATEELSAGSEQIAGTVQQLHGISSKAEESSVKAYTTSKDQSNTVKQLSVLAEQLQKETELVVEEINKFKV